MKPATSSPATRQPATIQAVRFPEQHLLRLALLAVVLLFSWSCAEEKTTGPPQAEGPPLLFPGNEWTEAAPGLQAEGFADLFEFAEAQRSTAVLIVQAGKILGEKNWPAPEDQALERMTSEPLSDGRAREDVASIQKSVLSFLVGRAVSNGSLSTRDTITSHLGPGWSKASTEQEGKIEVVHLLSMTSGLKPNLEFISEPATKWRYNTRAYSLLVPVLEKVTGQSIDVLTSEWLLEPLHMSETSWETRSWVKGEDANSIGLVTSARDLARFGLVMLQGDRGPMAKLLPEPDYLNSSTKPSQALNPSYGFLWWLNGQPFRGVGGRAQPSMLPEAPSDLYAAQGALGRRVFVVPSLDLVAVRLGAQPEDEGFDRTFWRHLMKALGQEPICEHCEAPLASVPSVAQTPKGEFIRWREHIIGDPTRGVSDLSGSDGLEMADLDGDGIEDIVSVHESDTVYDGKEIGHVRIAWGEKNPDGARDPQRFELTTLATGEEAAAAEDVSLADVNGDGYIDVLVACELAHLIYFQNPGANARTATWERVIPEVTRNRGSYIRAFLADFDGDGRPEVSAANKGEQNPDTDAATEKLNLSLYRIPEDPLDGSAWEEVVLGQVEIPINAQPVDLDGDGDLDVVAGSRRERRVLWFENLREPTEEGQLRFKEHSIKLPEAPERLSITGFNMDYADLNSDGRIDIVSSAWPDSVVLLTQPEDPSEPWGFSLIGSSTPDQLVSVRLADIDDDGDLDVFAGGYSRGPRDLDGPLVSVNDPLGPILWFENQGEEFVSHIISRRKRGMYDKWLMRDFDGDGDLDAIGTRGNSWPYDGVLWLEQLRSSEPGPRFEPARRLDSQEMGPPESLASDP